VLRRVGSIALLLSPGCFEDVDPAPIEDDGATDESSDEGGPAVCGDAVVQADEACDDGNEIAGDGCTACQWSGTVVWEKIEGSAGGWAREAGTDVAVDAEGRVFVSGVVTGGNSADIWVRAFDGADGTVLWTATEHRGEDVGAAVAADGAGGAFVAGMLGGGMLGATNPWLAHYDAGGASVFETIVPLAVGWGAAVGIAPVGDTVLTSGFRIDGIAADAVVAEFDASGEATGREYAVDAGLSDLGWRIAAAGSQIRATAYLSTMAVVAGWNDGFRIEPTWVTPIPGAVQTGAFGAMEGLQPISLAIADGGTTFVCATVASGTTSANFQLSRIEPDGQMQWSQQHDAGGIDICGGVAVDGAGDVVIVGSSAVSDSDATIAVAKYTASAELVWEATIEHDSGIANGVEVAVGPDGGIFITGAVGTADDPDIYVARLVP
jgi:cysteine-rich repeat protein